MSKYKVTFHFNNAVSNISLLLDAESDKEALSVVYKQGKYYDWYDSRKVLIRINLENVNFVSVNKH